MLAQAIVNVGLKNVAAGANPMDLKRGMGAPNFFSMITLRPLGPRVTFTASASASTPFFSSSRAGVLNFIYIPDSAKEKPLEGKVLAVGNGTKDEEMVLFSPPPPPRLT